MDNMSDWIAECERLGKEGNTDAYCHLGEYFLDKEDYKSAKHYFQLAYSNGDGNALYSLGIACLSSDDEKEQKEGFEYINRFAAQGDEYSFYILGFCYMNGVGVEKDVTKAVKAWETAVEFGIVDAMVDLGKYYSDTADDANLKKAMRLYVRAEENESELGAYNIGWVYANKLNDAQNAIKHFEKAISLGSYDAFYDIAKIYYDGQLVDKDLKKALQYFNAGAEKEDADCNFSLGIMYLNGQGVDADKQKAIDYFKKAAKLGSSSAKVNLAKCYLEGDGVKKNSTEPL